MRAAFCLVLALIFTVLQLWLARLALLLADIELTRDPLRRSRPAEQGA